MPAGPQGGTLTPSVVRVPAGVPTVAAASQAARLPASVRPNDSMPGMCSDLADVSVCVLWAGCQCRRRCGSPRCRSTTSRRTAAAPSRGGWVAGWAGGVSG